jgi:type III restriction enzyme
MWYSASFTLGLCAMPLSEPVIYLVLGLIFQVIPNKLTLEKDTILSNLRTVQETNSLGVSRDMALPLNLTLEMETGTGKTYVYLRTIMELYQKYGFSKFIIVVPTVAIKEGVMKSLAITKDHFNELYHSISCNSFEYSSSKLPPSECLLNPPIYR